MPIQLTEGFLRIQPITITRKEYLIVLSIIFLQQIQCLFRSYEIRNNSYMVQLMGFLSFYSYINNLGTTITQKLVVFWIINLFQFILSQIIIIGMFFVNISHTSLKNMIQIYIASTKILVIPTININFVDQFNICCKAIGMIFLIIQTFSYTIIVNYLGQDFLSYKSVQVFNQKGDIIDYTLKVVNNIFLTSISRGLFKSISIFLTLGQLAIYIMIPIHMDIILYPIKVGLWGVFASLQIFSFLTNFKHIYSTAAAFFIAVPAFILCYWGTQYRMKYVINKALIWLIMRKQTFQDIKINYEYDIEYIYIVPSLYAQLFIILYFVIGCPFAIIAKMLLNNKNHVIEALYMKIQKILEIKIEYDEQYAHGLMQIRLKHQTITLSKYIVYKDYVRQIQKRQKTVQLIKTRYNMQKQQYDIDFLTSYDYALVMTFISNSFMQYQAFKIFEGEIVDDLLNNKAIDVEYLKHLQVISLTKYPSNKYIKLVYYTVLIQYLNDYEQSKSQMQLKLQVVVSDPFINQVQYNKMLIKQLFGDINDIFFGNNGEDYETVKYDLHSQKIMYKLTGESKNISQIEIFNRLNKQWDALDQNFISLFDNTNQQLQLSYVWNFYEYYKTFINMIKKTSRISDNRQLYQTYRFAVQQYFKLAPIQQKKIVEALYYIAKYCDGNSNIEYNNEMCEIVNLYEPNNILMSIMHKMDVQVTIISSHRGTHTKYDELEQVIQDMNKFNLKHLYGPSRHQESECELRLECKNLGGKNIPMDKKYACMFTSCILINYIFSVIMLFFAGLWIYDAFSQQISSKTGYLQLQQDYNFVNLFKQNLRTMQASIMYPIDKYIVTDQQKYLTTLQKLILEQLKSYFNPFQGVYIYNTKETLFQGNIMNPITTVDELVQSVNRIAQYLKTQFYILPQQLYDKLKQFFISSLYMSLPDINQPNTLSWIVIPLFIVSFLLPVVFCYNYYWVKYISWRDYIHIARLFNEIPKKVMNDIKNYYIQRREQRLGINQMQEQNLYLNIFKILSFNYERKTNVEVQIRDKSHQHKYQLPFLPERSKKDCILKLKFVKNVMLIMTLISAVICYLFIFNDELTFKHEILTNSVEYQKINEQLYIIQQSFYKYQLLQKYFHFHDNRIYNIYLNLNETSTYNYFQSIFSSTSEIKLNVDIYQQLNYIFFMQHQMQHIENAAICKYEQENYNNCTDNKINYYLSKVELYNYTIDTNNCESIINNEFVQNISFQMTKSFEYVYQKINKMITELNYDTLHRYLIIQKILSSIYKRSSIQLSNKNIYYTPNQHVSNDQFVNTLLPKNPIDANINHPIFKDYYKNFSTVLDDDGFQIQKNQTNLQQKIYVYLQFLQYYLLTIEILCYTLILLSEDLNVIHRFLLVLPVASTIIATINLQVEPFNVNKIEMISVSNQYFFSVITRLDHEITKLLTDKNYNEARLLNILQQLYQFQHMYIMGQDTYAANIDINNHTVIQQLATLTFLLPIRDDIQNDIFGMKEQYENSPYIYQLNQPVYQSSYYNIFLRMAYFIQQYLKIYYKSLAYYCQANKDSLSQNVLYTDGYTVIKTIQQYNQDLLEILIQNNLSSKKLYHISPIIYSQINSFYGYNVYDQDNEQYLTYSLFLASSYELVNAQQLIYAMQKGVRFQIQQDMQYYNTIFVQKQYVLNSLSLTIIGIMFILFAYIVINMFQKVINYKLLSFAVNDPRFMELLAQHNMSKQDMLAKSKIDQELKLDYHDLVRYYDKNYCDITQSQKIDTKNTKKKKDLKDWKQFFCCMKLKRKDKQVKDLIFASDTLSTIGISNILSPMKQTNISSPIQSKLIGFGKKRMRSPQFSQNNSLTSQQNQQSSIPIFKNFVRHQNQEDLKKENLYLQSQEHYINSLSRVKSIYKVFEKLVSIDWINKKMKQRLFWMQPIILIFFILINTGIIIMVLICYLGLGLNIYQIELYQESMKLNMQAHNPLAALICELPENRTQCFFENNSSIYYSQVKNKLQNILNPHKALLPQADQIRQFSYHYYFDRDNGQLKQLLKQQLLRVARPVTRWVGYYSYTDRKLLFSKYFSMHWYQKLQNSIQEKNIQVPILQTLNSDIVSVYLQQLIKWPLTQNQTMNTFILNSIQAQNKYNQSQLDAILNKIPIRYVKQTSITECAYGLDDYNISTTMQKINKALEMQACTQSLTKHIEISIEEFMYKTFTIPCIICYILFIFYFILIAYIIIKTIKGTKFIFIVKQVLKQIPTRAFERLPIQYVLAVK